MLVWIFGGLKKNTVHIHTHDRSAGFLELERARVRWFLSINEESLPQEAIRRNLKTFRSIKIDGEEVEFSSGFNDLHTESYRQILAGKGFGIAETFASIDIASKIREATAIGLKGDYHPLAKLKLTDHPFEQ